MSTALRRSSSRHRRSATRFIRTSQREEQTHAGLFAARVGADVSPIIELHALPGPRSRKQSGNQTI